MSATSVNRRNQKPPKANLRPWEFPDGPWHRIHIDFAEPTAGTYILVLIDPYSNWIEAVHVKHPNSMCTIEA